MSQLKSEMVLLWEQQAKKATPLTKAQKMQIIIELMQATIKTGKRGRPKKLITAKEARKLLEFK
jgi:hypothetical protein